MCACKHLRKVYLTHKQLEDYYYYAVAGGAKLWVRIIYSTAMDRGSRQVRLSGSNTSRQCKLPNS